MIALKDVMMVIHRTRFKDVYYVYELMDTEFHQIINFKGYTIYLEFLLNVFMTFSSACILFNI